MKIVCKNKRLGGTKVDLFGKVYFFKPSNNDGDHICEVSEKEAIERLLAIPEAYHELGKKPAPVEEVTDEAKGEDQVALIQAMTNAQLAKWGKKQGFNPKSKQSIVDYADSHYETELIFDANVTTSALIREVMLLELEENTDEE